MVTNVELLLTLNRKLIDLQYDFRSWLNLEYKCGEISNRNKLFNFWELNEEVFFKQLKNKIGKINVKDYTLIKNKFEEISNQINHLTEEINKINYNLDNIIYDIYDLTEEENSYYRKQLQ